MDFQNLFLAILFAIRVFARNLLKKVAKEILFFSLFRFVGMSGQGWEP